MNDSAAKQRGIEPWSTFGGLRGKAVLARGEAGRHSLRDA